MVSANQVNKDTVHLAAKPCSPDWPREVCLFMLPIDMKNYEKARKQ
jgi:hypothetical protein